MIAATPLKSGDPGAWALRAGHKESELSKLADERESFVL